MSLESLAEAGERLCGPDIGRELVPLRGAKTEKGCDFDDFDAVLRVSERC